jgi:hypothetical protein
VGDRTCDDGVDVGDVYNGLRLRTFRDEVDVSDRTCDDGVDVGDRSFDDEVNLGDRSCLLTKGLS